MPEYKVGLRESWVRRAQLNGALPPTEFGKGCGPIGIDLDRYRGRAVEVQYVPPSPALGPTRQVARTAIFGEAGVIGIFTRDIDQSVAVGIGYLGPQGRWQRAALAQLDGGKPDSVVGWSSVFAGMPDPACRYAAIYSNESSNALDAVIVFLRGYVDAERIIVYIAGPQASRSFGITQGGWFGELISWQRGH